MNLLNLFRRVGKRPSQMTVPQYEPPTSTHQQIMADLVSAGATQSEALTIVAKSAARNWRGASGNHTRGYLHEAELNATEGRLGGTRK